MWCDESFIVSHIAYSNLTDIIFNLSPFFCIFAALSLWSLLWFFIVFPAHRRFFSERNFFFLFFILCVFTFLFYKHLLLFFLLPRFLSSPFFLLLDCLQFRLSVVFTVSILFTFGITKKFFLFIICVMLEYLYVWLSSCFLKIYSVVFIHRKYKIPTNVVFSAFFFSLSQMIIIIILCVNLNKHQKCENFTLLLRELWSCELREFSIS